MSRTSIASLLAVAGLSVAVAAAPSVAAAQAPDNDDVGSARPVASIPFDDAVAVAEATVEDGEPTETCAPFGNTVWYAVTLPSTTDVYVDTAGSNYDTTIAVWTGSSFDDVELVACNDDTSTLQAAVGFTADAGATFLVQVGAFVEAPPDATLVLRIGEPPKPTGKPSIWSGGMRGSVADVYVDRFDEATNSYSGRSMQLLDGSMRSKGDRPTQVRQLAVSSYEEQFDESDGSFTWTQWFGYVDLEPEQFTIDRRLRNAWVDADLTLSGGTCTETPDSFECVELDPLEVTVEATWTGSGSTTRSLNRGADSFDGARFRYRSNVSSRSATVDGGAAGVPQLDFTGAIGAISSGSDGYWTWIPAGGGLAGASGAIAIVGEQITQAGMQVESERFRGSYASAYADEYDDEAGTYSYRDVSMNVGQRRSRSGRWIPFDSASVYSATQSYDEVEQTVTVEEWFGSGPLTTGSVDRRLAGASATADVELWGYRCTYRWEDGSEDCQDLGMSSATIAVEWTGAGPTSTSSYSSQSRSGDQHVRFSGRSTNRGATANGTVGGGVVDWTLVDAAGSMGRSADGYWSR